MTDEVQDLFLKEKPCRILLEIQKADSPYASQIRKRSDTTYAHTVKIISRMEDAGLVMGEKKSRKKILTLTEKGRELADSLEKLFDTVETTGEGDLG